MTSERERVAVLEKARAALVEDARKLLAQQRDLNFKLEEAAGAADVAKAALQNEQVRGRLGLGVQAVCLDAGW